MKKTLILLTGLILLIIAACTLQENLPATGSLAISTDNNPGKSSAGISRNLYMWPDSAVKYTAAGTGPGDNTFTTSWLNGESCRIDSLVTGNWSITVTGFGSDNLPVISGSTTAAVLFGQTAAVVVYLQYIPGSGSVSFAVTWPADAGIAAGSVKLNNSEQPLQIDTATHTASYAYTSVAAGTGHEFSIKLFTPVNGFAYGTSGTVHVTNGRTTPVMIDIAAAANPPSTPSKAAAAPGCFCVDLSWDTAEGETGFFIDRRAAGAENWTNVACLPENTMCYKDISAASLTSYEYRVVAYNDNSESQSRIITITTPDFSDAIVRSPVAFGQNNGYRILADGSVMAYGANRDEQLGLSSPDIRQDGVIISGLSRILSVKSSVALYSYLLALDADGNVWRWGYQGINDCSVKKVTGITRQIIDISVGDGFFYALDADRRVRVWGSNYYGQLGNGNTTSVDTPAIVNGLPEIQEIVAGGRHGLALTTEGTVLAWGENSKGELGLGNTTKQLTPVQVPGITGVKAVRASNDINAMNSFLIMNDGSVLAAGYNAGGILGLPNNSYNTFTAVPGLANITDIDAGSIGTTALDAAGNLFAAGSGSYYNAVLTQPLPAKAFALLGIAPSPVIALIGGAGRVYCRDTAGNEYTWGNNTHGELMAGYAFLNPVPVSVAAPAVFTSLVGGINHYLAIDQAGAVWGWGANNRGQLGDGTTVNRSIPVRVLNESSPAIQTAVNGDNSSALLADGSIYCWGNSTVNLSPVKFSDANLVSGVVEIAVGSSHRIARKLDGTVWAWGRNDSGQLGNGTTANSYDQAVQVVGVDGAGTLSGAVKITAQSNFNAVLLTDNRVVSWGYDCLGNGTSYVRQTTPVYAAGITTATALFTGPTTVFALQDNVLWMWGQMFGVYRGTPANFDSIYIRTFSGITSMAIGGSFYPSLIALLADGTIRTSGNNGCGLLGEGSVEAPDSYWTAPAGPTGIVSAALTETSCAIAAADGTLWTWGYNDFGQAADGTIDAQYVRTPIRMTW